MLYVVMVIDSAPLATSASAAAVRAAVLAIAAAIT
jgi:hypothetical protein